MDHARQAAGGLAAGGRPRSTNELAKREGVTPVGSLAELAQPDLWESDEEYDAFLADRYASRRTGMA